MDAERIAFNVRKRICASMRIKLMSKRKRVRIDCKTFRRICSVCVYNMCDVRIWVCTVQIECVYSSLFRCVFIGAPSRFYRIAPVLQSSVEDTHGSGNIVERKRDREWLVLGLMVGLASVWETRRRASAAAYAVWRVDRTDKIRHQQLFSQPKSLCYRYMQAKRRSVALYLCAERTGCFDFSSTKLDCPISCIRFCIGFF